MNSSPHGKMSVESIASESDVYEDHSRNTPTAMQM